MLKNLKNSDIKLPLYGTSYGNTYYFKIRAPKVNERSFLLNDWIPVTIDVLILTVPTQPRTIVATIMAKGNTIDHVDATLIDEKEWEDMVTKHYKKLLL